MSLINLSFSIFHIQESTISRCFLSFFKNTSGIRRLGGYLTAHCHTESKSIPPKKPKITLSCRILFLSTHKESQQQQFCMKKNIRLSSDTHSIIFGRFHLNSRMSDRVFCPKSTVVSLDIVTYRGLRLILD
jgi:hypothetical protein